MDTKHPDEGALYAYVEGQLPQAESSRVETHVAGCTECASLVVEARGLIAAASGIIRALDDVPVNVIPPRRARPLPPWLAAAAVVVLAVGVSSVVARRGTDSDEEVIAIAPDVSVEVRQPDRQQSTRQQSTRGTAESVTIGRATGAGEAAAIAGSRAGDVSTEDALSPRRRVAAALQPAPARKSVSGEEAAAFSGAAEPAVAAPPALARVGADAAGAAVAAETRAPSVMPTGRTAAPVPAAPPAVAALSQQRQAAIITGRVMTEDGRPLAGANVFINDLNISVGTDANGRYMLPLPSGQLQGQTAIVRARAIGYAPQAQELALAGGTQTADFELRRQLTELSEVMVTGGTTIPLRGAPIPDASSVVDSVSARNAEIRATRHQMETRSPMRTTRYEVAPNVVIELREFHSVVRVPPSQPGINEFRWSNADGTRRYVLSGSLPVAELELLAARLGELRVVR